MSNGIPLSEPTLTAEHRQILRQQVIDENKPGTILRDFEILLNFIGAEGTKVSGKYHLLPMGSLAQLNAQLTHPIKLGLKRPRQKSYPHINGLYLLVRATGLTHIGGTASKPLLVLNDELLQSWTKLNPTERYFTLLETWLMRGRREIIGERARFSWLDDHLAKCSNLFRRIPDRGWEVAGDRDAEFSLRYIPELYNLALLEMFGLISVQHSPPEPGDGWRINRVRRTPLGDALLLLLSEHLLGSFEKVLEYNTTTVVPFGELQAVLQPYFPEWQGNLVIPELQFRDGVYIFKVSLGGVWRRIAIPAKMTLEDLSDTILAAYEFDHDHLYQFTYVNRFGVPEEANHPHMDEGPWTTEVLIGDLPLKPGATMTYLYDFGDNWKFEVKLERIEPADAEITQPTILETHGEAPEQYPSWEEW